MSEQQGAMRLTAVDYDPFATPELARAVPTTDAQREVWLADRLGTEASLAFNESILLTLRGALDVQVLQDALLALSDRHESLRATFDDEGANMLIAPRGQLQAALVDLRALTQAQRDERLRDLRSQAVHEPFDLVKGPLLHAKLVRLADDWHELLVTAHHIVCDGWSFGVMARELAVLYRELARGQGGDGTLSLADSFGDHALSLLEPEQVQAAEADERYWVSQFDAGAPVLDLPVDRPRPPQRSFISAREDHHLPKTLVDAARRLGASQGVSLFGTLFGLFAGLMERLGGEGEVVVGVPSAGQAVHGRPALVGHCVNLLPIRVTVPDGQSVSELLKSAGTRVLDAYDHQQCTFGRLLSRLNLPREANRLPLVSVQFNLDTALPDAAISSELLQASLRSNPRAYENFELFVNASQLEDGIVLECQYNRDLFDAETVRRWLELYEAAIERAVAAPQAAVATLFAASAEDRRRLNDFNHTERPFPQDERIETLIAAQARRSPQAVALVCGDRQLTYAEMESRARSVAQALRERGVGPGSRVGMACGRNVHLVPVMLGILKTGAAYVPLDPAFPAERLAYMVEDAELTYVVSDRSVRIDALASATVLLADDIDTRDAGVDATGAGETAAYVIYTSGSTGKPKGVAVPQRAVVNFLTSMAQAPGLTAADRLVAVTTASFDIAVLELFLPLTVGARVIVADRDTVLDGAALRALLESQQATVMQATPSGWRLLIDAGWMGGAHVKALVGGEALPDALAEQLLQRTGQTWNMYGPTETTVWSTCWAVPAQREGVRIGQPIANTRVLVLDDQGQVCPIGVPGEIFIGGDGVAIGYWQRDSLTDERFPILDGDRLYRTGDRGRWRNDGTLEHLGRLDFQVKVRGYRIELGEIEAALVACDGVEQAVVMAREDQPGDVRLVGYVVATAGDACDAEGLRGQLRRGLPDYMVPAHVVALPAIPLLPNGKVNRQALPRPQAAVTRRVAQPAASPLEAAVLGAMAGVLNLPDLGVEDDFFAMGGHSMLAARLVARLNRELDIGLPLRSVFEHGTARGLTRAIGALRADGQAERLPILRHDDQRQAPLTVMQERIRFMEMLHPGRVVYNTPSAHRLRGPMDIDAFRRAWQRLFDRQPSLRTRIVVRDGQPVQEVLDSVVVELPLVDLSDVPEAAREAELMARMQRIIDTPIAIDEAPLARMALYRLGAQEHVLLFMAHHIVWDGWSFDLLYQDMAELYPAALTNATPALPPLPLSYVDYAHWQAQWLQSDECREQIAHWKTKFSGLGLPQPLPADRPRQGVMSGEGAVEWVHVDKALTESLRAVAQQAGLTLNMLVMSLYAALLGQVVGQGPLVIGVPVRGRSQPELDTIMGFFNNLLPVPLTPSTELPFMQWAEGVKRELTQAFAHQEVPFERLAMEPEIARHASQAGLYQSLYSFQDARERRREWGPLQHSGVLVMQKGATEDFSLWLMEVPGGLEGGFNYNTALFDAATARLFRERLLGLMRRVVRQPATTVAALLADAGEDLVQLQGWIRARTAAPTPAASLPADVRVDTAAPVGLATPAQSALAQVWSELLGVETSHITARDTFFDLGGSSLLAMRAVAEVEKRLGVAQAPNRYVFESLGQLAADLPSGAADAAGGGAAILALGEIWAELLGVPGSALQPEDRFFDLGGSSLLAMRCVDLARTRLGLEIAPQRLLTDSLGQLAATAAPAAAPAQPVEVTADTAEREGGLLTRVWRRLGGRP